MSRICPKKTSISFFCYVPSGRGQTHKDEESFDHPEVIDPRHFENDLDPHKAAVG
ncbi:hypothetical protein B0H10DRAFT_2021474 [Mycena sp. CBHHK59/15]|nr:hypothetical protein B0H10DRAFT_2021474 [Mycena sp. CBHHK59/15]